MLQHTPIKSPSTARQRGMTLLEVVLAIAALGLVAASATTTMSFLYGTQVREQRRLGARELAHRLVLIQLDNPNDLPGPSETIPYAQDQFRYDLQIAPVALNPKEHVVRSLAARRNESPVSIDRLEQITLRVWLSEESGGTTRFSANVPNAVLVRLYDPHYFNRNPDSGFKMFDDQARREQAIQEMLGGSR